MRSRWESLSPFFLGLAAPSPSCFSAIKWTSAPTQGSSWLNDVQQEQTAHKQWKCLGFAFKGPISWDFWASHKKKTSNNIKRIKAKGSKQGLMTYVYIYMHMIHIYMYIYTRVWLLPSSSRCWWSPWRTCQDRSPETGKKIYGGYIYPKDSPNCKYLSDEMMISHWILV